MDAMADFLRQAARDNGIPLTNAAVVLPSTEVFTRELTMPALTEEDTRATAPSGWMSRRSPCLSPTAQRLRRRTWPSC